MASSNSFVVALQFKSAAMRDRGYRLWLCRRSPSKYDGRLPPFNGCFNRLSLRVDVLGQFGEHSASQFRRVAVILCDRGHSRNRVAPEGSQKLRDLLGLPVRRAGCSAPCLPSYSQSSPPKAMFALRRASRVQLPSTRVDFRAIVSLLSFPTGQGRRTGVYIYPLLSAAPSGQGCRPCRTCPPP